MGRSDSTLYNLIVDEDYTQVEKFQKPFRSRNRRPDRRIRRRQAAACPRRPIGRHLLSDRKACPGVPTGRFKSSDRKVSPESSDRKPAQFRPEVAAAVAADCCRVLLLLFESTVGCSSKSSQGVEVMGGYPYAFKYMIYC